VLESNEPKSRSVGSEPSDDDIEIEMRDLEGSDPTLAQVMRRLIKEGRLVDTGERKFQNGRWQIVWVMPEFLPKNSIN